MPLAEFAAGLSLPPTPTFAELVGPFRVEPDHYPASTYRWWEYLGRRLRPRTFLEFGVYRGYALAALLRGHPHLEYYCGVDDAREDTLCLERVEGTAARHHPALRVRILRADTQALDAPPCYGADLVHVDGFHTYEGAMHELALAWRAAAFDGVVVVDDLNNPDVNRAVQHFLLDRGRTMLVLPGATAPGLIWRDGGSA